MNNDSPPQSISSLATNAPTSPLSATIAILDLRSAGTTNNPVVILDDSSIGNSSDSGNEESNSSGQSREGHSPPSSSSHYSPPNKIPKYEGGDIDESTLSTWRDRLSILRLEKNVYFIRDHILLAEYPSLSSSLMGIGKEIKFLELNLEDAMNSCVSFFHEKGLEQEHQQYSDAMKEKFNVYLNKKYISDGEASFVNDLPIVVEGGEQVDVKEVSEYVEQLLEEYGHDGVQVKTHTSLPNDIIINVEKILAKVKQSNCPSHLDSLRTCCRFFNSHGSKIFAREDLLNDCLMFISDFFLSTGNVFTRNLQGRFSEFEPYSYRPDGECYSLNYNDERKKDSFFNKDFKSDWFKIINVPRERIRAGFAAIGLSIMIDSEFIRIFYHTSSAVNIWSVNFDEKGLCTLYVFLQTYVKRFNQLIQQ